MTDDAESRQDVVGPHAGHGSDRTHLTREPGADGRGDTTPLSTSDWTARLTAFLAKAQAHAGVTPEPRGPSALSEDLSTDTTAPAANAIGDDRSHESLSNAWRDPIATTGEHATPPDAADTGVGPTTQVLADTAPAPTVVTSASGLGLAAAQTDTPATLQTRSSPLTQPRRGRARPGVPHLGAMLLDQKLVTPQQLKRAMERQKRTRRRLGTVLVELGFMTEESVLDLLSAQLGVPSTRVNSYTVNPDAVQCLSEKVARKHMAFPLIKVGSTLVVAIASPTNLHALDDLRFASGCGIHLMVAMETEIQSALDKYYGNTFGPADNEEVGTVVIDIPGPQLDLHDEAGQRSAVSLVNRIIAKAVVERASDIHLEPSKNSLRVRFRIDGTFHEVAQLLLALAPAVLARIKVLSAMDIAEHRLPQDGRFSATVSGRGLDVRTSTYPTIWGEKAVLRLLDRTRLQLSIDGLMPSPPAEAFRELISRPEGILLVTGPTGSGKTSTLYAALAEIAEKGKNIITIEDPVEYWLPGVNQGQTNHKSGFTFARGMRAILRQDPDVIMVGEIRDSETLETAIEAALTGHLVMSTLHTNSAVATVTRLLEMGLEPYLLASAVTGILAQRLVRRTCERCKEPIPTPLELRHLFQGEVPSTIYRGIGCDDCRGTGFLGRQGIFELLVLTDELRVMMHERASEVDLTEVAKRSGMTTLRDACLARVADGTTTLEEVIRVTKAGRDDGTRETTGPTSSEPFPQLYDPAARTSTS